MGGRKKRNLSSLGHEMIVCSDQDDVACYVNLCLRLRINFVQSSHAQQKSWLQVDIGVIKFQILLVITPAHPVIECRGSGYSRTNNTMRFLPRDCSGYFITVML